MREEGKTRNSERFLRAANKLNQESFAAGNYKARRGKIVQFFPCPRANVFLAATYSPNGYRPDALMELYLAETNNEMCAEEVLQRAYFISCMCHPNITLNELRGYEYED